MSKKKKKGRDKRPRGAGAGSDNSGDHARENAAVNVALELQGEAKSILDEDGVDLSDGSSSETTDSFVVIEKEEEEDEEGGYDADRYAADGDKGPPLPMKIDSVCGGSEQVDALLNKKAVIDVGKEAKERHRNNYYLPSDTINVFSDDAQKEEAIDISSPNKKAAIDGGKQAKTRHNYKWHYLT